MLCKMNILRPLSRSFSSSINNVQIISNEKTGVSTLTMQRPPVNSLNTDLLQEISTAMDSLEKNKCRGLILTSSIPNIFSAGLDLMEFYGTDAKRLELFWTTLQDAWLKLYTSSFPTAAVVNGHSPAGGCMFAMSCEYRVMLDNFTIGLNEAKIGIPAPFWFMDVMRSVIGARRAEISLTSGNMFTSEQALDIGLVDEVAVDTTVALQKGSAFLEKQNKVAADTRAMMKREFRRDIVLKFEQRRKEDLKFVLGSVLRDSTQKRLQTYFEAMKKKMG